MNRTTWEQIQELVESALEMPVEKRAPFFEQACPDSAARHLAQSLVASYEEAGDFLETPAVEQDPEANWREESMRGHRLGPYELLAEIGKGGMGTVYRARRADLQFDQAVAIKLLRDAMRSSFSIARFKAERQILASLNHPNVARLLDGGTSPDGTPYLVMELVDGCPIDEHCAAHGLKLSDRIRLFRIVCSAVQYAHRHLIVHRDIKPGNILVTADGTPKLLDFGIAKILDPDFRGAQLEPTIPFMRLLTPEYASPEQVRGEAVTTASDVYSLGIVLYFLLSGRQPYSIGRRSGSDIALAVCDTQPLRPSVVAQAGARHLRGDLDTIVLKAIQKDPQRRYESVEQLSEDLRRHLEGLPITARPDSFLYGSRKFVKRHLTGVVATSCVVLALLAGMLATVREAKVANAQRQRAERRFNDVRKLANSLFDIHDSIQSLPGATSARKLVVDNAVRYLDGLAQEAEGDSSLERELANGYYRLGLVQGGPTGANLGDKEGALASFRKSLTLRDRVAHANPKNIEDQINRGAAHRALSVMLSVNGKPGAAEQIQLALGIEQQLARQAPANRRVRRELGRDYETLAGTEDGHGRWPKAIEYFRASYKIAQEEVLADPKDRRLRRGLGVSAKQLGSELAKVGSREEGLRYINESLGVYEALAADPNDGQAVRELAVVKGSQAAIFMARGEFEHAFAASRQAQAITRRLLAVDPEDSLLRMDLGGGYLVMGTELGALKHYQRSLTMLNQAVRVLANEEKASESYADLPYVLSWSYQARADLLYSNGDRINALADYRRAEAELKKEAALPGSTDASADLAPVVAKLAALFARAGQFDRASMEYQRAVELAKPLFERDDLSAGQSLAEAYTGLAKLQERKGALQDACSLYAQSASVWQRTPNPGVPDVSGLLNGNAAAAARALAACLAQSRLAADR